MKHEPDASPPRPSTPSFEQQWRERFAEFAALSEDDAGIAGWSASGLDTRFRFFRRLWESREKKPGRFLDVGCGAGTYTQFLAGEPGLEAIGVDYSLPTLVKARRRVCTAVELCAADATHLPFGDAQFDGALCFGVLQAIADSTPAVRELARVLRPGAGLWIDALNRGGVASRYERARLRWRGKSMHLRYESPRALAAILEEAGFERPQQHWLPILPSRLQRAQPLFETRAVRAALRYIYPLGTLLSHSFVLTSRKLMV